MSWIRSFLLFFIQCVTATTMTLSSVISGFADVSGQPFTHHTGIEWRDILLSVGGMYN